MAALIRCRGSVGTASHRHDTARRLGGIEERGRGGSYRRGGGRGRGDLCRGRRWRQRDRLERLESRPKLYARPVTGYEASFIGETVRSGIEKLDGRLEAIGISMFGQIEGSSVTGVPRSDWPEKMEPLDFARLFCGERWDGVRVTVGHDSTTSALAEYRTFQLQKRRSPGFRARPGRGGRRGRHTCACRGRSDTARKSAGRR
jgi:hypothetical protein